MNSKYLVNPLTSSKIELIDQSQLPLIARITSKAPDNKITFKEPRVLAYLIGLSDDPANKREPLSQI